MEEYIGTTSGASVDQYQSQVSALESYKSSVIIFELNTIKPTCTYLETNATNTTTNHNNYENNYEYKYNTEEVENVINLLCQIPYGYNCAEYLCWDEYFASKILK